VASTNIQDKQDPRTRPHDISARDTELSTKKKATPTYLSSGGEYDMGSHMSSNLQDILESSSNAEKVMLVMTVCTDRVSRVEGDPKYLELSIIFIPPMKISLPNWIDVRKITSNY
jgi:hypothetical protein